MNNTKWVKTKEGDYEWKYLPKDILVCKIYKEKNGWEIPAAWFGRKKNYQLKRKKSLNKAKAACEKWLNDFIKNVTTK